MEKRYFTKTGEIVWVNLAVSMATDDRDRPAYFIAQIQDITDSRAAHEELTHRALHDPLTGLPNRDLLMDRLSHTLARSARAGTLAAVMFCDLDDFKSVNDTYGHEAGDELLVGVAERLRGVMRPGDTVARLGGDEFVVVAEGLPDAGAVRALAERVRQAVDEPVQIAGHAVRPGPASASSSPRPRTTRGRSCARPTPPCTGRRRWDVTGSSSGRGSSLPDRSGSASARGVGGGGAAPASCVTDSRPVASRPGEQ